MGACCTRDECAPSQASMIRNTDRQTIGENGNMYPHKASFYDYGNANYLEALGQTIKTEEDHYQYHAVVIDNGSYCIKAGFCEDELPRITYECLPKSPMKFGLITNWQKMEKIWKNIFDDKLSVNAEDRAVLLSESISNTQRHRQKSANLMFEKFNVPQLYIANQSFLSLLSCGKRTGIVINCGYEQTRIVPVYDSKIILHAAKVINIGGKHIDQRLKYLMRHRTDWQCESYLINYKEHTCFIDDGDENLNDNLSNLSYRLPDGNCIQMGDEIYKAPEILFESSSDKNGHGIAALMNVCVDKCEYSLQRELCDNVVLSGGTMMLQGMEERLGMEMMNGYEKEINIVENESSEIQRPFIGGCIFSSCSEFDHLWILKSEYDECGSSIIHRKYPNV